MLVPFLIMMREGIEAALIVGIVAGYLRQTGRRRWMPAVWAGIFLALALCLGVGIALDRLSAEFPQRQQEMFEAAVGLIAVCILTSMVFWMKRAARSMKSELHDAIDKALAQAGAGNSTQALALVGMVFFAVAREGLESVFFLLATFEQSVGWAAPIGALAGLLVAFGVGAGVYFGAVALNLRVFFRWTGFFILFVAAGLLAGSIRSLHESGLWNGLQARAFDLSHALPSDSPLGMALGGMFGYLDTPTVGEVAAYLLFLIPMLALYASESTPTASAPSERSHKPVG
jgi:high-affinity iron transporter